MLQSETSTEVSISSRDAAVESKASAPSPVDSIHRPEGQHMEKVRGLSLYCVLNDKALSSDTIFFIKKFGYLSA